MRRPEIIDAKRRKLFENIRRLLDIKQASEDKGRFFVEMKPLTSGKEIDYEARISFKNAADGQKVMNGVIAIGNAKVRLTPELKSQPFYVTTTLYHYIKDDLNATFKKLANVTLHAYQTTPTKDKENSVKLSVEVKQMVELKEATTLLRTIAKGEHIQLTEQQFRYFSTPSGRECIEMLKKQNSCIINVERRLRTVIVFGEESVRKAVRDSIEQKKALVSLKEDEWEMRLDTQPFGFIKRLIKTYNVSLDRLYKETGISYVTINIVRRIIKFCGTTENILKCKVAMKELRSLMNPTGEEKDGDRGECPVCFDVLETTSHQLEICSHSYCKECFQMMCQNAIESKELPMQCAYDGCEKLISINDIIEYLEPKDIVPVAVEKLVAKHKDQYSYCITPDCLNVYMKSRKPDPDPFHCTVCQVQICTYCDEEYHGGLECRFNQRKEDDNLRVWLEDNKEDHGLCPNCSAPIDKYAGCLHVTCAMCKKHVCWRCKQAVFNSSNECYDHLGLCGGIFR